MIEIINMKDTKPSQKYDFIVDRRTPVGNPFIMNSQGTNRDKVCDMYTDWFNIEKHTTNINDYLMKIIEAYNQYNKIRLFCWCAPKRCHAETIRDYLLKLIKEAE